MNYVIEGEYKIEGLFPGTVFSKEDPFKNSPGHKRIDTIYKALTKEIRYGLGYREYTIWHCEVLQSDGGMFSPKVGEIVEIGEERIKSCLGVEPTEEEKRCDAEYAEWIRSVCD